MARKNEEQHTVQDAGTARPRRSGHSAGMLRRLRRILAGLLVLLLTVSAALAWALRSESGQAWLLKTINATLESSLSESGLRVRLTRLAGPLPFACSFGLEAADAHGVWLTAPENSFDWDWRALPGAVRITAIRSVNPALTRLPDLPPAPAPAPQPPLTVETLRLLLGDAARALHTLPGWLPAVRLDALELENALLPPEVPGGAAAPANKAASSGPQPLRADLKAGLAADGKGAKAHAQARLTGARASSFSLAALHCTAAEVTLDVLAGPEKTEEGIAGLAAACSLEVSLQKPVLSGLPPDLLGSEARLQLDLKGGLSAPESGPLSSSHLALSRLELAAGRLTATGRGEWQSGDRDWPDGPLDLALSVNLQGPAQEAPAVAEDGGMAAMLRAPASLSLSAGGALLRPHVALRLACADMRSGGHVLRDAQLSLTGAPLALGAALGLAGAAREEARLLLELRASLDQRPLSLSAELFYGAAAGQTLEPDPAAGFAPVTAGLRKLRLSAAGLEGAGHVTALLAPGSLPALNGKIGLRVADWQALSAFVPGQRLDGEATLELELGADTPDKGAAFGPQRLVTRWHAPRFSLRPVQGEGETLHVRGLGGELRLADLFGQAALTARLDLAGLEMGDLHLAARASAGGPLQGPLDVSLESTGGVVSHLNAQWRPGRVLLKGLNLHLNDLKGAPRGRGRSPGLRAARQAEVRYGEAGLAVSGLDLVMSPSGRLQAQGTLAPEKLDLRVMLEGLSLEPWRALAPALPLGTAEARVRLSGSPARPSGDFRLGVRALRMAGSPLAPLDVALAGGIEHGGAGSALTARLELDPRTVKALGGSEARLTLRLPLLFGPDGLPRPAPQGRLAGQARWEGAAGPVWSLLPLADRRLNGRVSLNMDLGGTLAAPRVTGGLRVSKARYEDLLLGVLLTDINLRLDLDGKPHAARPGKDDARHAEAAGAGMADGDMPLTGSMRLELTAADGLGGSMRLAGGGGLDGRNLDLRATLDHLRPLRRRDLRISLSGRAQVTGSATAPDVRGEIVINQGALLINNLDVGGGITTLPIEKGDAMPRSAAQAAPTAAPAVTAEARGSLNLRIRAPGRFMVEGHGLTSEWQADLLVGGSPAAPVITGELRALKGNFDFLTRNFSLARGVITFGGGALSNPLLDMALVNETPDLTAQISITGTVSKMKLSLSSEPALPRDEILARILFGRSTDELSRLEALQLAGAVAQLAGFGSGGGGMLDFTRKALGVDVLRLGTSATGAAGEPGDQSAGGATLEMGKYVGDLIYLGVQQGMKPDSTAFIIQLELTPRINLELRTEQQDTWGGVRWKYNY